MSFVKFFSSDKSENKEKGKEKTELMNSNIKNITEDVNKGNTFLDSLLSNIKTQTKKEEDLEEKLFETKKSKFVKDDEIMQSFNKSEKPKTTIKEKTQSNIKTKNVYTTDNINKDNDFDTISKDDTFDSIKKSEKLNSIDRIDFTSNVEKSKLDNFKYSSVFSSIKNTAFKTTSFLTAINFWFIIKIFIIIIIISTLGFNIFLYLAEGTDFLQYIINEYAKFIPVGILNTMKMSAIGIRGTAETTENNLNTLQENVKKNKPTQHVWEKKNKELEKSLNKDSKLKEKKENELKLKINRKEKLEQDIIKKQKIKQRRMKQQRMKQQKKFPKPFNQNGSKKRNGWCFIGNDRNGTPHCAKINDITKCNSGNISSTREICMNPLLRN